ncbi:MAG: nicotinate-nucleotide--dimethylbenzimidazole phosphoribosyltransferase [Myxococcota bacterium]|nr:nicotinate-nucleotide--dimethylbenzimidazole phosphoribosyltransferase [Myxococcota bacterium]
MEETVSKIGRSGGKTARIEAHQRLAQLTMPFWALGRLMDLAEDLAEMTGVVPPPIERKTIVTMAADHGVAIEGTSKYPREVTAQMVHNFVRGGAGINALARQVGAQVAVVDMGVAGDLEMLAKANKIVARKMGWGTSNLAAGPAMDRTTAVHCIEAGIGIARDLVPTTDVFGTGDMGIGNTTPSSAIVATMCNTPVETVTGRGTGLDDEALMRKIAVVERALAVNTPDPSDPLDVLAKVGGFEIGGIAGVMLGAASTRKPILIDGFISTAAALIAVGLAPGVKKFIISSHQSAEPGHRIALDHLGFKPLLDLEMRLGEGTGCALAMHLVDASVRILTDVATFEEAGVSSEDA